MMALRFESGDVFPAYSSLRSDPLGAKVLYKSLSALPGITVDRNFRPFDELLEITNSSILLLGLDPTDLQRYDEERLTQITALAESGNRIIIAFHPIEGRAEEEQNLLIEHEKHTELDEEIAKDAEEKEDDVCACLESYLGIQFGYHSLGLVDGFDFPAAVQVGQDYSELPESISLHSELFFTPSDQSWSVLYSLNDMPVIIERSIGAGSLVMVADAYLVSNEAMRMERHAGLLTRLIGNPQKLVFDEAHFGIVRQSGIMVLMRQYRLTPLLLALCALAGLYIWQRSVIFVPLKVTEEATDADEISRMDYHAGLVNLLRRNIAPGKLLSACLAEWRKGRVLTDHNSQEQTRDIEQIVRAEEAKPLQQRNIPACYGKITNLLAERKRLWK